MCTIIALTFFQSAWVDILGISVNESACFPSAGCFYSPL